MTNWSVLQIAVYSSESEHPGSEVGNLFTTLGLVANELCPDGREVYFDSQYEATDPPVWALVLQNSDLHDRVGLLEQDTPDLRGQLDHWRTLTQEQTKLVNRLERRLRETGISPAEVDMLMMSGPTIDLRDSVDPGSSDPG